MGKDTRMILLSTVGIFLVLLILVATSSIFTVQTRQAAMPG